MKRKIFIFLLLIYNTLSLKALHTLTGDSRDGVYIDTGLFLPDGRSA